MPAPELEIGTEADAADEQGASSGQSPMFVDAATRVSKPSAFDDWYYGIEDKIGQGTIGMGVCVIVVLAILFAAMVFSPI